MQAISKLSISGKLFSIVSLLFLVIAIIGGFAFMQMRAINTAAHDIQAPWLPSVRWVGEMRVQSARYRAVLRDHLIVADAERADADNNLAARKTDFEKAMQAYRLLISSPAEREFADQLEKQWQSFAGASTKVQSRANRGDVATVKDINAKKVVPTGRAMDATLAKLVELNNEGAETAGQGADASYSSALLLMAGILGGAIVLGLGAAIYMVGDEVKALATQTAKATAEIDAQVADMQSATAETVSAIKEIGSTITLISEVCSVIAAAVEQQGAATQEVARNVQQSAQLSTQVSSEVTEVKRGTGETSAASGEVLTAARSLSHASEHLKVQVEQFLETVRAA